MTCETVVTDETVVTCETVVTDKTVVTCETIMGIQVRIIIATISVIWIITVYQYRVMDNILSLTVLMRVR